MLSLTADTLPSVSVIYFRKLKETETGKEASVHPKLHPQVTFPISPSSVISAR